MLVTVYEHQWFVAQSGSRVVVDSTRMAQGIMTGIGFYIAAGIGVVLTLGTLSVFRWIEGRMPIELYSNFTVRFARESVMPELALRELVARHGFSVANLNYRLLGEGGQFEYRMVVRTLKSDNVRSLSEALNADRAVVEYRISPASD
jgi:putative Mg2+ transporter-C (MgtC) family protein